jgi:Swiss Army Knife RNA repair-like protein
MNEVPDGGRPLVLIDVDGVLRHRTYHEGWTSREVWADGEQYRIFLNPAHGKWLRDLADETGAELAWASTWQDWANVYIGPVLGLPALPVAPAPRGHKVRNVIPWTKGRPFVWFDDDTGVIVKAGMLADSQPHKMIWVPEKTGLTLEHIAGARTWLARFAAEPA